MPGHAEACAVGVTINGGGGELGVVSKEGLAEYGATEGVKLDHELVPVVHDQGQGKVETQLEKGGVDFVAAFNIGGIKLGIEEFVGEFQFLGQQLVGFIPVARLVANSQVLVAGHQVYVEPFRKGEASRCSVNVGVVDIDVFLDAADFVGIIHVFHLDVAEFNVGTERSAVLEFLVVVIGGSRHGGVNDDSIGESEGAEKQN